MLSGFYILNKEGEITSRFDEPEAVQSQTSAGTVSPLVLLPKVFLGQFPAGTQPYVKVVPLDTSSGAIIGMEIYRIPGHGEESPLTYDPFSGRFAGRRVMEASVVEARIRISFHDLLVDPELGERVGHRVTEAPRNELIALKNAAESKNRREFARLASTIKWFRYPPTELTRAIDLALALDMVQMARELTQEGRKLFRHDKRIQQAASVLSPPFFMRTQPVQITNFELSQQWLKEHSSHYRGLWVAVRAGTLLGSAPTLRELYERIGSMGRTPDTIIVKVLS